MEKINKLVIIGNGFDLTHGLKTSFYDFINYCVSEILESICNIFSDNDIFLENNDNQILNLSNQLSDYKNHIQRPEKTSDSPNNHINKKILREMKQEIEIFLSSYTNDKDGSDDSISIYIKYFDVESWIKLEEYCNSQSTLPNKPMNYNILLNKFFQSIIQSSKEYNWSGIENDFYKQLLEIAYKNTAKDDVDKLNKDFKEVIHYLEKYLKSCLQENNLINKPKLSDYLRGKINNNEIINDVASKIKKEITPFQDFRGTPQIDLNNLDIGQTLLLNFNYTNTIESYTKLDTDNKYEHIHIHGELNNNANPIIFGYGDEIDDSYKELENKNDNRYLAYAKSMHYLSTSNYKNLLNFLDSGYYQIYIWGHSCSTSDRVLLNTLFEHKNCISIKPFYHKKEDGSDNYIDLVTNINRNFKNKKLFRDVVVNKERCKPLSE